VELIQVYDAGYYSDVEDKAVTSARTVLPWLLDLLRPRSIVDVGCGTGAWLATSMELGVQDCLGLDGPWVPREDLRFPEDLFRLVDLGRPLHEGRTFDLAICLEVAEHLPAAAAETIVASLAELAPVILFSASVPGQRGDHHVNEQWPPYWAQRFASRGLDAFDIVRPRFWQEPAVAWWYAQNVVLYVAREAQLPDHVRAELGRPGEPPSLVHPGMLAAIEQYFARQLDTATGVRQASRNVVRGVIRRVRRDHGARDSSAR
jgi:SAM-dependent methyltransferase